MNILIFSWRDPKHPLAGGAEQVIHEHAKGWIKAGHQVTLFSSRFNNSLKDEVIDGIQIIRGGHQYLGVQLSGFLYYLQNQQKFDFVIDQFHGLPFFTPLYVRKPKLAVVQEPAKDVWFLNPFSWPLNWIVGLIGYFGEPFIYLFYQRIPFMTGSQSAKDDVIAFGISEKDITVVPHGVIIQEIKPLPKKDQIWTVTYLGILSKDKGIEDALKCFALLAKQDNFQFWVIGRAETNQYYSKILGLVDELGLKQKVKFWGYVGQEEKFKLLARSHILINSSAREGWGLVVIEAAAMQTPTVGYNVAGLKDSIKNNQTGILTENNNPENLAEAAFNLLKDQKRYLEIANNAKKWSKNFSWQTSIQLSLDLINRIYGKK